MVMHDSSLYLDCSLKTERRELGAQRSGLKSSCMLPLHTSDITPGPPKKHLIASRAVCEHKTVLFKQLITLYTATMNVTAAALCLTHPDPGIRNWLSLSGPMLEMVADQVVRGLPGSE